MTFECRRNSSIASAYPPTPYRLSGAALRALRLSKGITLERAARHIQAVHLMSALRDVEDGRSILSAIMDEDQARNYLDWLNSLPDATSAHKPK